MLTAGTWTSISLLGVSFTRPVAGIAAPSQQTLILLSQVALTGLPVTPGLGGETHSDPVRVALVLTFTFACCHRA